MLLFENNKEVEDFVDYVQHHMELLKSNALKQHKPCIMNETKEAKCVLEMEIRYSYALKEMKEEWKNLKERRNI